MRFRIIIFTTFLFVFSLYFQGQTQNNAMNFTATSNMYVEVATSRNLIAINTDFTVEAWVNYSGANRTIIDSEWRPFYWQLNQDGNNHMGVYNPFASTWGLSTGTVPQNTWTHVAIVKTGTTIEFFINGISSGTITVNAYLNTNNLVIGRQSYQCTNCIDYYMNGSMDELRVWGHARSASEILTNMNTSILPQAGLQAYYTFNQTSGDLIDKSGYNNDGILFNGPSYVTSGVTLTTPACSATVDIVGDNCLSDEPISANYNEYADSLIWTLNGSAVQKSRLDFSNTYSVLATGFNKIQAIAKDGQDNLYVADYIYVNTGGGRGSVNNNAPEIIKIEPGQAPVVIVSGSGVGSVDPGFNPISIAFDDNNLMYVADKGTGKIWKFEPGFAGPYTATAIISGYGTPFDVKISSLNIYVSFSHSVYKFPLSGGTGVLVAGTGTAGNANTQLNGAERIEVFNDTLYCSETAALRVSKWAPGSTTGVVIAGTGVNNSAPSDITPTAITFDEDRGLLICSGGTVKKFKAGSIGGDFGTIINGTANSGLGIVLLNGSLMLVVGNDIRQFDAPNKYFSPTVAGTYQVEFKTITGCVAYDTITIYPQVVANASVTSALQCFGDSSGVAVVSMQGGTGLGTFLWSTGGVDSIETGLTAGNYFVTITDSVGCFDSASVSFQNPMGLTDYSISAADTSICKNSGTTIYTASSDTGVTYSLYEATNNTIIGNPISGTGSSLSFNTGNLGASTDLYVKAEKNNCEINSSIPISISVFSNISLSSVITNVTCYSGSDGAIDLTVSGGTLPYTFSWDDINSSTTEDISNLGATQYQVSVTDSIDCPNNNYQ